MNRLVYRLLALVLLVAVWIFAVDWSLMLMNASSTLLVLVGLLVSILVTIVAVVVGLKLFQSKGARRW